MKPRSDRRDLRDRIKEDVVIDDAGCWIWQRYIGKDGYGYISICRPDGKWRMRATHRVAYIEFVGPVPQGLDLDHLCRVRACCNPAHLEPVTRRENLRRGLGRWWDHQAIEQCARAGHDLTAPGARLPHGSCRKCHNEDQRKSRQKRKEAACR